MTKGINALWSVKGILLKDPIVKHSIAELDTIAKDVISSSTFSHSPIDLASYGTGLLVLYKSFYLVTVYSSKLTNHARIGAKGNATANNVTNPY